MKPKKPRKFLNILMILLAFSPGNVVLQQNKPVGEQTPPVTAVSIQPHAAPPRGDEANLNKVTINLPDGTIDVETRLDPRYVAVIIALGFMETMIFLLTELSTALKQNEAYEEIELIDDENDECISSQPLIRTFIDEIDNQNKKPIAQELSLDKIINYLANQQKWLVSDNDREKHKKALEEGRLHLINCFEATDRKLSNWKNQFGIAFPATLIEKADSIIFDLRKLVSATYNLSVTSEEIKNIQTKIDSLKISVEHEVNQLPGKQSST